jgi:hypothetical protein
MQSAPQRRGEKHNSEKPPAALMQSAPQRRGDEPGWTLKEPCDGCDKEKENQTPGDGDQGKESEK